MPFHETLNPFTFMRVMVADSPLSALGFRGELCDTGNIDGLLEAGTN